MKKTLSERLADNLAYYINSPFEKRCVSEDGACFYSGNNAKRNTQGCFIGRLLPAKDRLKIDAYFHASGISGVLSNLILFSKEIGVKLPKYLVDNKNVFSEFQTFHDSNSYWLSTVGLTHEGKLRLKQLIKKYHLDNQPFQKFLI